MIKITYAVGEGSGTLVLLPGKIPETVESGGLLFVRSHRGRLQLK